MEFIILIVITCVVLTYIHIVKKRKFREKAMDSMINIGVGTILLNSQNNEYRYHQLVVLIGFLNNYFNRHHTLEKVISQTESDRVAHVKYMANIGGKIKHYLNLYKNNPESVLIVIQGIGETEKVYLRSLVLILLCRIILETDNQEIDEFRGRMEKLLRVELSNKEARWINDNYSRNYDVGLSDATAKSFVEMHFEASTFKVY